MGGRQLRWDELGDLQHCGMGHCRIASSAGLHPLGPNDAQVTVPKRCLNFNLLLQWLRFNRMQLGALPFLFEINAIDWRQCVLPTVFPT